MGKKKHHLLFNKIAPAYGLFYNFQKKHYHKIINTMKSDFDLTKFDTVIDIGCGTGSLCNVLHNLGLEVTGIDPAQKMLDVASSKPENKEISFVLADVLECLPFEDQHFDIAIASYVAHGLSVDKRLKMYAEMSRVTSKYVVFHDYNKDRALLTSFVEWVEQGDYFNFIKVAEPEMRDCMNKVKSCFKSVKVIQVGPRANWYICEPNHD
jgi:ubiquinone/menaquinone biosynthesis C-methylase UbiE